MVIAIRTAVEQDAEAIGEAHAEAWRIAYEPLFSADFLSAAVADRRAMWPAVFATEEFSYTTLLVAEDELGVLGFVHFGPAADGAHGGEIYGFYVHPRGWGGGVATALMREATKRMATTGFPRATLWTHAGAGRARGFYEKSGWEATGRHEQRDVGGSGEPSDVVEYAIEL